MKEYQKVKIEVVQWGEEVYMDVIQTSGGGNQSLTQEQWDNTFPDFFD